MCDYSTMSTWIIGDVHGCFVTLKRLLERIEFDPDRDRVIQVGDLANKGPGTLEVLRWARGLGDRFRMVLGNHDLHLLARAAGGRARKEDTLDSVFEAPDREALLSWLTIQPLMLKVGETVIVHAGFMPEWPLVEAEALARECESGLRAGGIGDLHERRKVIWSADLDGHGRAAAALGVFTRIRTVRLDGRPLFGYWGPEKTAPKGARPWFENSTIVAEGWTTVFGHWATLGVFHAPGAICLDSGCVYGGSLSAMRLEDGRIKKVDLAKSDRLGM
ncbi:MAG: symmetrical bis(5'-nucleosyl)-tetraphosphatase [Acidobacteria bacterium]|nr:symmetrical bis(5'-nucleosyl)-tetraphosphatase [Acidobacteriota bacterium]